MRISSALEKSFLLLLPNEKQIPSALESQSVLTRAWSLCAMTDNSDRLQEQGMRSLRRLQEQGLSMARTLRPESNPLEDLGYRSCILREATHNESKAWRRLGACNLLKCPAGRCRWFP